MSIKTFFQPWLIQPTYPMFVGAMTEYDALQEADDLSAVAISWVAEAVDQLDLANDLYAQVAEESKAEMARHRERRAAALAAITHNKLAMSVVRDVIPVESEPEPEPVAAEPNHLVVESEPEVPVLTSEWLPVGVDTVEEPVPPRRRRRKAVDIEGESSE